MDKSKPSPSIMKADILIVHINGIAVLEHCLSSIYKNTNNPPVYLLFNATSDNSPALVKRKFPKVKAFFSKKRLGFASASNFLAKKAKSENIVFLNNDTEVGKNWLSSLLSTMQHRKNCIAVQPKVKHFFNRKKFEYAGAAGGFIDKYGYPFCRGRMFGFIEEDKGQYNDEIRIFWGCGVCLLVNRKFFLKTEGFDESLHTYAEELDFCWRCNILGKEIWYSPKSVIYHMGSFSVKKEFISLRKEHLITRNHLLVLLKNYSLSTLLKVLPFRIVLEVIAAIRFFPHKTLAFLMSMLSVPYLYFTEINRKRNRIQKQRRLSDVSLMPLIASSSVALLHFLKGRNTFKEVPFPA